VKGGRLLADAWGRTSQRAVFAGGDASTGAGTVVDAIGSGTRAAEAMALFFEGRDPVASAAATRLEVDGLNLFYFGRQPRSVSPHQPASGARRSFQEVVGGLTWHAARVEAARCFSCGLCTHCDTCLTFCPDCAIARDPEGGGYAIDTAHCKGCGICAAECPRGALTLVPEELR
jgi:Pyruvate/2-oxoacid:ferredoxin oxidoreductase delta subunit